MSKKEELLNLLNKTEKKIIKELVNGTPNREIPENVGITLSTASCTISSIYKKTKGLIDYGKKSKMPVLLEFLFKDCGFRKGEDIDISEDEIVTESNELLKSEISEDDEVNIKDNTSVEVVDGPRKPTERDLQIANVLSKARSFLEETCNDFYYEIGRKIVENPDCDIKSSLFYQEAVDFAAATKIISSSIRNLTAGEFKNV